MLLRKLLTTAACLFFVGTPPAAFAHPGHWYWSTGFFVDRDSGARFTVGRTKVVLRADTLTCQGEGRGVRRRGGRGWKHFRCVQPTFPRGALVGPDALFRLHVIGRTKYVISDARIARY